MVRLRDIVPSELEEEIPDEVMEVIRRAQLPLPKEQAPLAADRAEQILLEVVNRDIKSAPTDSEEERAFRTKIVEEVTAIREAGGVVEMPSEVPG